MGTKASNPVFDGDHSAGKVIECFHLLFDLLRASHDYHSIWRSQSAPPPPATTKASPAIEFSVLPSVKENRIP